MMRRHLPPRLPAASLQHPPPRNSSGRRPSVGPGAGAAHATNAANADVGHSPSQHRAQRPAWPSRSSSGRGSWRRSWGRSWSSSSRRSWSSGRSSWSSNSSTTSSGSSSSRDLPVEGAPETPRPLSDAPLLDVEKLYPIIDTIQQSEGWRSAAPFPQYTLPILPVAGTASIFPGLRRPPQSRTLSTRASVGPVTAAEDWWMMPEESSEPWPPPPSVVGRQLPTRQPGPVGSGRPPHPPPPDYGFEIGFSNPYRQQHKGTPSCGGSLAPLFDLSARMDALHIGVKNPRSAQAPEATSQGRALYSQVVDARPSSSPRFSCG